MERKKSYNHVLHWSENKRCCCHRQVHGRQIPAHRIPPALLTPSWQIPEHEFKEKVCDQYTFIWYFAFNTKLALLALFWGQSIISNVQTFHSVLQYYNEMSRLLDFYHLLISLKCREVSQSPGGKYQQSHLLEMRKLCRFISLILARPVRWFCHAGGPGGLTEATSLFDVAKPAELSCPTLSLPGDLSISGKKGSAPVPGHTVPSWQYLLRCFLLQSISVSTGGVPAWLQDNLQLKKINK